MYVSIAEAQGQLLDLVRRAEAGEEVLLTHEGKTVGKIGALSPTEKTWKQMTKDERLAAINEIVANAPPKPDGMPDAAHSQDFLYDDNGLPRVIVVDTSAIFAVLYAEPMGPTCAAVLAGDEELLASAGTLAEMGVVAARSGFTAVLDRFLERLRMQIVPVDAAMADSVGRAYAQWGKGLHPAKLNFGDCFAYTLAKERGLPLLFIGDDFALTDVTPALP